MCDERTSIQSSFSGLPLPVSLAAVVAILGLIGLRMPGTLLNFSCLVLLTWLLAIIVAGILRFNRNEVLSRISGTTPNQLTFDSSFWMPIISYVGVPILAVLATLMPTVGRTLFGWTSTLAQMFSSGGN